MQTSTDTRPRRALQFTLRGMLVVIAIACICCVVAPYILVGTFGCVVIPIFSISFAWESLKRHGRVCPVILLPFVAILFYASSAGPSAALVGFTQDHLELYRITYDPILDVLGRSPRILNAHTEYVNDWAFLGSSVRDWTMSDNND
jgi:hypothetical protein